MRVGAALMFVFLPAWLAALSGLAPLVRADEAVSLGGDVARGQELFAKLCANCHEVEPNKHSELAPGLYGVFGSRAGSRGYIYYSEVLKSADFIWTVEQLDGYLAEPEGFFPGNLMANLFGGLSDPQMRSDIIAYLGSLEGG